MHCVNFQKTKRCKLLNIQ